MLCFFIGIGIGVFHANMIFFEAANNYGLLAIGSYLSYLFPGMLLTAAGKNVVSSSSSEKTNTISFFRQIGNYPESYILVSLGFFILAIIPGTPGSSFLLIALLAGVVGFAKIKEKNEQKNVTKKETAKKTLNASTVIIESILPLDMMEVLVGSEIKTLIDTNNSFDEGIKSVRQKYALEMGFIIPKIPIRIGNKLKPNEYEILIKGATIFQGEAYPGRLQVTSNGNTKSQLEGINTIDSLTGKPALWISPKFKSIAETEDFRVMDLASVLILNIDSAIKFNGHELLGRQEVSNLLSNFKESNPKVVDELVPNLLPLGKIKNVLQNLVAEHVSIRDLRTILENLADYSSETLNTNLLTEKVRSALSRSISKNLQNSDGIISVLEFDKNTEEMIVKSMVETDGYPTLVFEPEISEKLLDKIKEDIQSVSSFIEGSPIILTSPSIRRSLKSFTLQYLPDLLVVSYNEIVPKIKLNTLKVITLDEN
jgi:flagellar biosynthesis protein FlhA